MFLRNFLVTLILSIIVSLVYTEIHCYHLREVYFQARFKMQHDIKATCKNDVIIQLKLINFM